MLCHIPHMLGKDVDWLFFVHGLGGNSKIFYKQTAAYKPHFNLMFVDLFGHGCTLEQLNEYTFETLADGIGRVMDDAGIDSAHMMGVSLGTIVLEALCLIAPGRIKSLVLSGAVQGYDRRARFLLKAGSLLQRVMPYMMLYRLFAFIMMPKRNHAASRHFFIREAKSLGGQEFRKWYRLMTSLEPFYARFPDRTRNTIPRLYISGDEDHLFLPFVIRNALPDPLASLHVIERCGHVCNIENAPEFNRITLEYLKHYPDAPKLRNIPDDSRAHRIAMRCGHFPDMPR
jgi:pimeloyl-ACP methyl ester carboxylesterase